MRLEFLPRPAFAYRAAMSDAPPDPPPAKPVERLFPFVRRARAFIIGRDNLLRNRQQLQFVLLTTDISDNSREQILRDFAPYPIVQRYTAADLDQHFGVKAAKVIGFTKSALATAIYAELKPARINQPLHPNPTPGRATVPPAAPPAPAP